MHQDILTASVAFFSQPLLLQLITLVYRKKDWNALSTIDTVSYVFWTEESVFGIRFVSYDLDFAVRNMAIFSSQ